MIGFLYICTAGLLAEATRPSTKVSTAFMPSERVRTVGTAVLSIQVRWKESREVRYAKGMPPSPSRLRRVMRSEHVVGVVKSHRSLYASGAALGAVLRLKERERSSVFLIEPEKRASVASWYLRIRDARGRDPMWGLVRIEVAPGPSGDALTERADEVSRWILAETAPVSLPDGRWHTMLYGVRDCEEFLRAIT